MEMGLVFLLFVLAATLQLIPADKDTESSNVSDFSRCQKIEIKKLHVHDEVCVKIAYVPSEIGIEVAITWNGKVIFKTKVSIKHPPPLCFKIPLIKSLKACLELTDVSFEPHHHGACLAIELKAFMIHKTFKLGCIYKEIKGDDRKTPLEILRDIRALVNSNNREREKSGNENYNSGESGHEIVKKLFLDSFDSRDVENQVEADDKIVQACVCSKPRKCVCCKNVILSRRNRTKVCGKVIVTKKGKGLWVSLLVDQVKSFRVYTPVSRRFKFACGRVEIHRAKAVVCLHLKKVVETEKGISLCLSAVIHLRPSKRRLSFGCVKMDIEEQRDDLVKFKPFYKLVF